MLYEMLTARRPFDGETITDVLAAVVTREPAWELLPAATPAGVRRLLVRCLQKDPKLRLRDIGEARLALDEVIAGGPDHDRVAIAHHPSRGMRVLPWVLASLLAVVAIVGATRTRSESPPDRPVLQYTLAIPGLEVDRIRVPVMSPMAGASSTSRREVSGYATSASSSLGSLRVSQTLMADSRSWWRPRNSLAVHEPPRGCGGRTV